MGLVDVHIIEGAQEEEDGAGGHAHHRGDAG